MATHCGYPVLLLGVMMMMYNKSLVRFPLKMEAVSTSTTSVSLYQIKQCNIPEDSPLPNKSVDLCNMTGYFLKKNKAMGNLAKSSDSRFSKSEGRRIKRRIWLLIDCTLFLPCYLEVVQPPRIRPSLLFRFIIHCEKSYLV